MPKKDFPAPCRLLAGAITLLGWAVLAWGLFQWTPPRGGHGPFYLLLALIAACFQLQLPRGGGAVPISFAFVLLGIAELSLREALLTGAASATIHTLIRRRATGAGGSPLFAVACAAIAVTTGYHAHREHWLGQSPLAAPLMTASLLCLANTLPAAIPSCEGRWWAGAWKALTPGLVASYLAGGTAVALYGILRPALGEQAPLLLLPVASLVYWSHDSAMERLARKQGAMARQVSQYSQLIESLVMAIEAKAVTAHDHIRRLQLYCVEIGRRLRLDPKDLEALRVAALVHDIGKLAVPEHILAKSGKLTREEFEKVKIHPVVGAEILERIGFPRPIVEAVRFHHEKWSGEGYPSGIQGDEIPIVARILCAVDQFDALISDRPDRRALSVPRALSILQEDAGRGLDPIVVRLICELSAELEPRLSEGSGGSSTDRQVPQNTAGLVDVQPQFLATIAAARQEANALMDISVLLGKSLRLDETLPAFSDALRLLVPADTLVVYLVREGHLVPRYASGECTSLFLSHQLAVGQGITGPVVEHNRPVLNGNPVIEMGATSESMKGLLLNSALVVPLPGSDTIAGAIMLCRRQRDAFTKEDLRILHAVSDRLGSLVDNAIKYEQAAATASTDFLTGLPNARALKRQLEIELARSRRLQAPLTVLVTDLDGFKEVNDRFGHLEGNSVLQAVAAALRNCCREYDFIARMGGDEFVILLPGLAEDDVMAKVAQLNGAVIEAGRTVVAQSNLGLSIGRARFPEDGDEPERLLAEADQRMYQAKVTRKLRDSRSGPRGYDFDWLETTSTPS
jgi:diguanylate cyclase (GGDEF)-like protein/putative nucleotidyltransferase with HDIG domain